MTAPGPRPHVRPLEVNVGGIVPPDELVGRAAEIQRLLALAAPPSHGAMLLGDRRVGKTSLLRAVEEPLREAGHVVVRVSAETASLADFGRALASGLRAGRRWDSWGLEIAGEGAVTVGIARIGLRAGVSRGARSQDLDLFAACAQAARSRGPQQRVIFLLDEITVLATELARADPAQAREFMRMLRRARQEHPELAMFLAGSIGLHHALPDGTEVNDLTEMHVDVLPMDAALELAQGLVLGAGLDVAAPHDVAVAMVTGTSGFPFYLHGTAQLLSQTPGALDAGTVRATIQRALDDDLWNTRHYDTRLDDYYGQQAELARDVLDAVATARGPVTVDDVARSAGVAAHAPSRTAILGLLHRLERDHYLRRTGDRTAMANGLMGQIWRHVRRL